MKTTLKLYASNIVLAALLMRATGLARFPEGMDLRAMLGLGLLCGIGFTMSLFIGILAFPAEAGLLDETKIGVFIGSLASALLGAGVLMMGNRARG